LRELVHRCTIRRIFGFPESRSLSMEQAPTIRQMRDAAAQEAERTSLRAAARAIGISPTGLKKFLDGTNPYAPTRRRLRRWLAERGDQVQIVPEGHVIEAALNVLFRELPHDVVAPWRERAYQCLEAVYGAPITRVSPQSAASMLSAAGADLEGAARRLIEQHARRSCKAPAGSASERLPSVHQVAPGAWLIVLPDSAAQLQGTDAGLLLGVPAQGLTGVLAR
jgi:hypothetical protein